MARSPNPKEKEAIKLYKQGMKLKDIADQLELPQGTIRRWKSVHKWDDDSKTKIEHDIANARNKKNERSKKAFDNAVSETMENEELTDKQKLFCVYYAKEHNAVQAYMKAYGCTYQNACSHAWKLMKKADISCEIDRLIEMKAKSVHFSSDELVELHMRIAFSDIGNYLSFGKEHVPQWTKDKDGEFIPVIDPNTGEQKVNVYNTVDLKESDQTDTQIIQEVTEGKNGISVKLADKQRSIRWLEQYFLVNPLDRHKIEYDNARLELDKKKIEPDDSGSKGIRYQGIPASIVAPVFAKVIHDIEENKYREFVFPGGRGSTKSSFISLEIIDLLEKNPEMHAAVYRQVADTLRDSVYAQICWAIQVLGLEDKYKCTVSPMEVVKKSTGQKIFFRGCDDPFKSKGIKAPNVDKENAEKTKKQQLKMYATAHKLTEGELEHLISKIQPEMGYIGILWFEELDQFHGDEAVRTVTQSVIRGGEKTYIFKSFNPPKSANNWANKYIKIPKPGMLVTHSTYLDVPETWLGKPFMDEAEHLKEVNPSAYENEYMGVANGNGGNVFDNVTIREITDEEISEFDRILNGVDWGWFPDPFHFSRCYFDAARRKLYIFAEYRCNKQSNRQTADTLIEKFGITSNDIITCDSAEQKSIGDYKQYGLLARPAEKGPGSVERSMKWLMSLAEIVIDNSRCPETANEFLNYEYDRDKEGNIISGYPDKDNHGIDAVRYATNDIWKRRGA